VHVSDSLQHTVHVDFQHTEEFSVLNNTKTMDMMNAASNNDTQTEMQTGSMYFTSWNEYELYLLFSGWRVHERWQFVLTWFAVFLAVIVFHVFDSLTKMVKESLEIYLFDSSPEFQYSSLEGRTRPIRPKRWIFVKSILSLVSGIKYSFSLFLMLIAMTYNPALFLALFLGSVISEYFICDFLIDIDMKFRNFLSTSDSTFKRSLTLILGARRISNREADDSNMVIGEGSQ